MRMLQLQRIAMNNLLFCFGFSTLVTHELDAVAQSEWRLLFMLRRLSEHSAASVFVALHVPLIALLSWLTFHESKPVRYWSRLVLSAFLVVHAGMHKRLEHHLAYTFTSPLSLGLIYGAGLLGLAYIASTLLSSQLTIRQTHNPKTQDAE